jgi:hypothetical protein
MADATYTNIVGFAPEIAPYAQTLLGKAQALTDSPYQTYGYDRIAQFNPLQEQSFLGAENLGPSYASIDAASGLLDYSQKAADTTYNASNYGNQFQSPQGLQYLAQNAQAANLGNAPTVTAREYNAPLMGTAQTGYSPNLLNYQMGPAQQVGSQNVNAQNINAAQMGPAQNVSAQNISARDINAAQMGPAERVSTQSFAQPGSADAYMSPYMQSVVDIQKREAARQSGIQGTQQQAQAAQAGAFGGARDAIQRAERERNLSQQMGDIQAQGSQAAYTQAQQQFNAEQQARLQAQQANQAAGLTVGGQNLTAQQQAAVQNAANQLQASGMNAQQAMQAALANQQAGLTVGGQNLTAQQQANVQNVANQLQASGMNAQQAMQAALANQQAGLTVGQQNLSANLGVQQLGAQTGVQTALANLSAEQQANVQNQAAQLQTQGMNAQQAMQAALANQQTQSQYGLQQGQLTQQANLANQAAQNQAGQFNAGQNLQAASLGAQYGQAANQLNEQSNQFGAGLGLQGLQAGMQGASNLGAVGQNIYGQQANALGIQNAFGGQQQQQTQNVMNQQYQDFLNQENAPYKQLNFMSDIVRGTPTTSLGSSMYQSPPSLLNQVAGLGTAAAGLFGAANKTTGFAKGGRIRSKKPAGLAALLLNSMA